MLTSILVAGALVSCASRSAPAAHRAAITPASAAREGPPGSCTYRAAGGSSTAFELSIAPGVTGARTPQKAAIEFVLHGGIPGYGTSTTTWVATRGSHGVDLRSAHSQLHVRQLPNTNWVVDSGQRCG